MQEPEQCHHDHQGDHNGQALRPTKGYSFGQPGDGAELASGEDEAFAIVEVLVARANDEAHQAIHDEHHTHRGNHEGDGPAFLLAVVAVDGFVGQHGQCRSDHDTNGQGEQGGRQRAY